jgi:CubicO group peptidase (beta-lactamase class C family)
MQPDTLFRIAAMTRPVTVAAALALADAGRLILSDPVARWLPGFADLRVGVEQDGRLALVPARRPMTVGDFFWGSALGTCFWADPARGLQCVLMLQENDATLRAHYRAWLRQGVYGALLRQDTP